MSYLRAAAIAAVETLLCRSSREASVVDERAERQETRGGVNGVTAIPSRRRGPTA